MFNFGIYGFVNQQVPLYVNLEGSLIIPTIGEVQVAGYTLREAKERVIAKAKKRYYSSDISLTLTTPRTFLVKVTGMSQGVYEVSSVIRPTSILAKLYYDTLNVSKYKYMKQNAREFYVPEFSLRNIELIRKDGTTARVDI